MADELIETLTAAEGRNDGEAIASLGRSIVFLPKGVNPGQQVRVRLIELAKKDSRGRTMYRAEPAPVEYTERWKDNGDGTASRVTISTSWLLKESEEGELEIRPLETREAPEQATIRADRVVEWGADLASSVILEEQVKIIPTLAQKITPQGTIVRQKVGEREEKGQIVSFPLTRISLYDCRWKSQAKYEDSWSVQFGAYYQNKAGETWINVSSDWGSMPDWWRKEQEARYPVCSCGRQRRDPQVSDGYAKCELCRTEEKCVRCGQQADSKATQIAGRIVCETCRPLVEQEGLVASLLSDAHKQMIAEEAKRLLVGNALTREEGLAVLEATMDHEVRNRLRILQEWSSAENPTGGNRIDRLWYYFCGDATYGSLYSRSVLQIFELLPQASGNALVELVAWIANGNFYLSTQISGRNIPSRLDEEEIRRVVEKLKGGKPVLADRLHGTEKNLQAELSQLREKWDATAMPATEEIDGAAVEESGPSAMALAFAAAAQKGR